MGDGLGVQRGNTNELVIGVVAPVGVKVDGLEATIRERLREAGYDLRVYKLSNYIRDYLEDHKAPPAPSHPEHLRLAALMNAGNKIRRELGNGAVAQMAVAGIHSTRPIPDKEPINLDGTAHLIVSLKNPEEVRVLRRIYASSFFVIGVHSSHADRVRLLRERSLSNAEAESIIAKDEEEDEQCGQQTRKAFQLADTFIRSGEKGPDSTQLTRFLALIFGHPYETPTIEEQGMIHAYVASMCSGSLSRQVGAAILSQDGDLLATGRNDTPRFGGGLCWPNLASTRDADRGIDSNDQVKDELIVKIMRATATTKARAKENAEKLLSEGKLKLRGTGLLDLTEYGRDVHAEMEALLSAARNGIAVKNASLYTTTFPCHNCAKHIVAAGIKSVYYIEPYPKSRALELFSDSIELDSNHSNKVRFEPFTGVGPRRFFELFSMSLGNGYPVDRKQGDGRTVEWSPSQYGPRTSFSPSTYIDREGMTIKALKDSAAAIETGDKTK